MRDRIKALKSVLINQLRGFQGGNPKTYNDGDRTQLEASVENHGYVLPIAVRDLGDGTFEIIDGHHRVEVLLGRGDVEKIKVLILDVDSVADGRRILLALQRHAAHDMTKLEDFVAAAIAEGVSVEDLMADTGFSGTELDAFANAGQDFLSGIPDPEDDKGKPKDEGPINEGVSKAGLNPEHVQFAVPLSREQSATVHEAIKLAKKLSDRKVSGDALEVICAEYLDNHKTAKAASK